jgi:hypothetical protein
MQGIQIADPKAPWVMFERRADEDRAASIAAGHYVTKDVDYAQITPHGSRDQIERVASEWFTHLEQQVREGRFDPTWLRAYKSAYEEWKLGKTIPPEGTPILNWPVLSPSQVNMLQANKILTVEVLAQANEETIARLGMGGRRLKDMAVNFLAQVNGPAKVASQLTDLKQKNEGLESIVKAQAEQLAGLKMQLAAQGGPEAQHPHHEPSGGIGAADLLGDDPAPGRKL